MAGTRGLAVRTRYLDDMLAAAIAEGVRQVVILAAGMDARAYRLPWPTGTVIYEVERADVMALNERVMATLGAVPKAERRAVRIDLRDDFASALRERGFQAVQPAAFLVEGLLVYLPDRPAVLRILREVAALGAPGHTEADLRSGAFLMNIVPRILKKGRVIRPLLVVSTQEEIHFVPNCEGDNLNVADLKHCEIKESVKSGSHFFRGKGLSPQVRRNAKIVRVNRRKDNEKGNILRGIKCTSVS